MSYDPAGNLTAVTDLLGHGSTYAYDSFGELQSVTDFVGSKTQFTYTQGSLSKINYPLGNESILTYDPAAQARWASSNPFGQTTLYAYDALNQQTLVTDAAGGITAFTYDPNGNLLSVKDPLGHLTSYTYDVMDRLATVADPLLRPQQSYEYDQNGNLTQFTDRRGKIATFNYDSLNRLIFTGYGKNGASFESTMAVGFDAGSRVTSIADSSAGNIISTYDLLDRLSSDRTPQGSISYNYDAAGRKTSMTASGQTPVAYSYDTVNRLTGMAQASSNIGFTYDSLNRRSSLTLPNGVTVNYGYDALSRLSSVNYQAGSNTLGSLVYGYDATGHRTQVGGTFARTNLPPAVSSAAYDAANQLLNWNGTAVSYDLDGNMTSDGTNIFTWNARNQVSALNGAPMLYDAFGRRIQNKTGTTFMYDGADAVQELSNSTVTANSLFASTDEVLTRTDSNGVFTPLRDTLGSTVALADASGSIATTYTYDPFGNTTASGPPNTNPFQYTGRENDGNGLYYYRARYYSTNLNRFISEDPAAFDGGINFYVYGADNPISFVDPFGMKPCPKLTDAQDAAMNNPDFQPVGKTTHCSEATESIVNAVGAPPLTGNANAIAAELAKGGLNSGDYMSVNRNDAQGLADSGDLVIAAWSNPDGEGHVATVRPLGVPGDHPIVHAKYPGRGPLLNNIGTTEGTGINNENGVFLSNGKPSYYTPTMAGRQPCP